MPENAGLYEICRIILLHVLCNIVEKAGWYKECAEGIAFLSNEGFEGVFLLIFYYFIYYLYYFLYYFRKLIIYRYPAAKLSHVPIPKLTT